MGLQPKIGDKVLVMNNVTLLCEGEIPDDERRGHSSDQGPQEQEQQAPRYDRNTAGAAQSRVRGPSHLKEISRPDTGTVEREAPASVLESFGADSAV